MEPRGFGPKVAVLEPGRALVLHGDTRLGPPPEFAKLRPGEYSATTWAFHLEPIDAHTTRLIERFRLDYNPSWPNRLAYRVFLEPGSFIMEQKMLRGIRDRAEAAASA